MIEVEGETAFGPIGRCIYCGATRYNDSIDKLRTEHIVPHALCGQHVLLEASCQRCERVTGKIEQQWLKCVFQTYRRRAKYPSRKSKKDKVHIVDKRNGNVNRFLVESANVPTILTMYKFGLPEIISGEHPKIELFIRNFGFELIDSTNPLGVVFPEINLTNYCMCLAKIAHCFAVAFYGLDGFKPTLVDFILGKDSDRRLRYVGGVSQNHSLSEGRNYSVWHSIVRLGQTDYVAIQFRLIGEIEGTPTYLVIAGHL